MIATQAYLDLKRTNYLIALVYISLTFLGILIPYSFGLTSLENALLPLAIVVLFTERRLTVPGTLPWVIVGFVVVGLLSMVLNQVEGIAPVLYQIRVLKLVVALLIVATYRDALRAHINTIIKSLFWIVVFICLIQIIDPLNLAATLTSHYSSQIEAVGFTNEFNRHFRLYGVMNNPNDMGLLLSFFIVFFTVRWQRFRQVWSMYSAGIAVLLLLLTQSRTGIAGMGFAIFYFLFLRQLTVRTFVIGLISVGLAILILVIGDFQYVIQGLLNPLENSSMQSRIEVWSNAIEVWRTKPFFGVGLSNVGSTSVNAIDSQYMYILQNFGLVGLSFFLVIIIQPFLLLRKVNNEWKDMAITFTLVLIVVSLTNLSITNPLFGFLFVFLIGMAYESKPKDELN